jgi:linoleoyl-CoA desaturase
MSAVPNATKSITSTSGRLVFTGGHEYFKALRARVDEHFGGRNRCDDRRLHRKASLIALWFVTSYLLLLTARSGLLQLFLCVSYALAACALGFNVFHDANHGSFSSNRRVNLLLACLTCVALGPSRYLWCQKHHVLHHAFTNVFHWDDDIETRGHLRMSWQQPWERKFRNQHRFFVFFYALSTVEWFFVKDFVQYFRMSMTYQPIPPMSTGEKVEFWASKTLYLALFFALPFAFLPAGRVVMGLLLFHLIFGLALTFVFQIAHGTEKVEFPAPTGEHPSVIEDEWAAHEMRTTVNFAISNPVLTWFAGGLNFQIEHHLFPHISHTHYPDISDIVRRTAGEHGLPYNLHDTYINAVKSHYRFLQSLGNERELAGASD